MATEPPSTAPATGTNRRILVVDDNPAIHADIRKILCPASTTDSVVTDLEGILFDEAPRVAELLTFEVHSAHQGQEALELVRRSMTAGQPFAVAFMDVRMPPGWDGIETISRIWAVDPSIQMVVCTAYSDYSWEEMRSRLGQPESLVVLKKPFDNVEVQQLAHALTRKWQLNLQAETATRQLEGVIRYMNSLLEAQQRLTLQPSSRVGDIRYRQSTVVESTPHLPAPPTEASISLVPAPEAGPKPQLGEVLTRLKDTLESTFRELRETEMQLVQAEKMASLGRLSAGIMHEINNPLNYAMTAINVSDRYADAMKEETRRDFLENRSDVKDALLRISNIVHDLRDFTGPQFRNLGPVDLEQSLSTALRMLAAGLPGDVSIVNRVPAGFEVRGVSGRLTQVFLNLLQNAVDALGEKEFSNGSAPEICIDAAVEGGLPTVRIRDNGPGIPETYRQKIFDPFFTTKEAGRGTGLGLSICYRLLREVGASIRVQSEAGAFTEFTLQFPDPHLDLAEDTPAPAASVA